MAIKINTLSKALLKKALYKQADMAGIDLPPGVTRSLPTDMPLPDINNIKKLLHIPDDPADKTKQVLGNVVDAIGDKAREAVDTTKDYIDETKDYIKEKVTPNNDGMFGFGNTWMVDQVHRMVSPDEFYSTDNFRDVPTQLLNDMAIGSLTGAPATAAYYAPWAVPKKIAMPFRYTKWSLPFMAAGRLGTEFDRGLGTYVRLANEGDREDTDNQIALVASGRNRDAELEGTRNYDRSLNDALVYLNNQDKWEREQNKSGIEKGKDALRHLAAIFTTHPYHSVAHYMPSMGWPETNASHFPKTVEEPHLTAREVSNPQTMAIIRQKQQEKKDREEEEALRAFKQQHSGPMSHMNQQYVRPRILGIF